MIIIFDLDHTLMNSEKFKNCLPGIFKLTKKRFLCEIDIYFKGKKDLYSPLKHAVLRYKNGKINKKLCKNEKQTFLFSQVHKFICLFRRRSAIKKIASKK